MQKWQKKVEELCPKHQLKLEAKTGQKEVTSMNEKTIKELKGKNELYKFKEHTTVLEEKNFTKEETDFLLDNLCPQNKKIEKIKFVGLDRNYKDKTFIAGYYIGLDWIEETSAIIVDPKIENLNYLEMFMSCFNCDEKEVRNKLKDIYHIDFTRNAIEIGRNSFELTPMLIVHFLKLTESLVKKGLKRDYILEEDNLNSKIKGKIVFSQHLKKNFARGREDRIYCRYQDYSVDCMENRIIKKTLLFVNSYLNKNVLSVNNHLDLQKITSSCLAVFAQVSDDISIKKIKQFKINPLYHEYAETLKVAKMILKRFGYAIENANKKIDEKLPPFWIDMALLFEVYVLSLLKKKHNGQIIYQAKGNYGNVDFLYKGNSKIIIDTKYKPSYSSKVEISENEKDADLMKIIEEVEGRFTIEDVRQLSGYARDKKIRKKLLEVEDNAIIPCLIIYPLDNSIKKEITNEINLNNSIKGEITNEINLNNLTKTEIPQFLEFYKLGIKLPMKQHNFK